MGCVSSKHVRKEIEREHAAAKVTCRHVSNHVVSLTSSTYGALKLDSEEEATAAEATAVTSDCVVPARSSAESAAHRQSYPPRKEDDHPSDIINAWELMEDLEEAVPTSRSDRDKDCQKPRPLWTPLKILNNNVVSPRTGRRQSGGKENRGSLTMPKGAGPAKSEFTPGNEPLKSHNSCKAALGMRVTPLRTPKSSFEKNNGLSSRRNLGPLFDPDVVAINHRGEQQIKKILSPSPKFRNLRNRSKESESILSRFTVKCPPGGDKSVVIYTTTLRGIRQTFEDCNAVRSVIESHIIRASERDVSMDAGYKEELRGLMGSKEVKVPMVFVKGRMVGAAEEVLKLEEEGKLGILFDGIPRDLGSGCEGCGDMRFLMCVDCNGSCKVLDEQGKKSRCGECNENGLMRCPICS
ncbi:hypothetical protein SAY86_021362 [Trapa natans]|uniref:Glutaredoxin domain-containing protein n=1 Tax=Trapa natans TaxID=22666 RepID=A0AAN7MSA0_TRANT|nr:hypothetical protein SAY86_021362 [Trapa natans]